jgi:gamma-glutamyl hercynylcysteine S-oxide synthase
MVEDSPLVIAEPTTALEEARQRTLAIVAPFDDATLEAVHDPIMSPLVWDLAHIAAYEDLWLCHRAGGVGLLHPELAAMYDAFETPRAVRGDLKLLNTEQALEYLAEVRERALSVLPDGEDPLVELVLRHEHQHNETMLQAIELARLGVAPGMPRAALPRSPSTHLTGLEPVDVPGGRCRIGAAARGFAYDNERPRHETDVRAFRIGRVPITNATYLTFVEGGGYERREWWTDEAWTWKEEYDITHPGNWTRGSDGQWLQRRIDGAAPLALDEPVVHVSWFEATAFATAHGARLPTETEWEKAATWDQDALETIEPTREHANLDHGGFGCAPAGAYPAGASPCGALGMLGDVWEWTSSPFRGYDGFVAHPYREYSEVFFGDRYRVLRGGSWATRAHTASCTFRNWDLPQRRQIFSGVRLAWDA